MGQSVVGDCVVVNVGAAVGPDVAVGDEVAVGPDVAVGDGVAVGTNEGWLLGLLLMLGDSDGTDVGFPVLVGLMLG